MKSQWTAETLVGMILALPDGTRHKVTKAIGPSYFFLHSDYLWHVQVQSGDWYLFWESTFPSPAWQSEARRAQAMWN